MRALVLIRHYCSVAICCARLTIQEQLEYPFLAICWFFIIPIEYLTSVGLLKVIINTFNNLEGWSFPQLTFAYSLALLSRGVVDVFFIQLLYLGDMVLYGELDRMMLRPLSVFFQFTAQNINFIGLVNMIPAIVIFLYSCKEVSFLWTAANIAKIILTVIGGVLIRISFFMIIGTVCFWTKSNNQGVELGIKLLERSTMYPLSIYPFFIQFILTFILPLGFICFYPSCEFLNKNDGFVIPLGLSIWTPAIGVLLFYIAQRFLKYGLKHYESTGS